MSEEEWSELESFCSMLEIAVAVLGLFCVLVAGTCLCLVVTSRHSCRLNATPFVTSVCAS